MPVLHGFPHPLSPHPKDILSKYPAYEGAVRIVTRAVQARSAYLGHVTQAGYLTDSHSGSDTHTGAVKVSAPRANFKGGELRGARTWTFLRRMGRSCTAGSCTPSTGGIGGPNACGRALSSCSSRSCTTSRLMGASAGQLPRRCWLRWCERTLLGQRPSTPVMAP